MGRPKRNFLATAEETANPPASLENGHQIARVRKAEGKNLYSVEIPDQPESLLVELPSRFRSQIWIKRGGFVVVDRSAFEDRDNKLDGEIVNIVRDEKQWRKQAYWLVPFLYLSENRVTELCVKACRVCKEVIICRRQRRGTVDCWQNATAGGLRLRGIGRIIIPYDHSLRSLCHPTY